MNRNLDPSEAELPHPSWQVVLGGFVEALPMLLFYVNLSVVVGCIAIFAVAAAVGESMLKDDAEAAALLPLKTESNPHGKRV